MNKRIKQIMQMKHLTAQELAFATGVSKYTIDRYVQGKTVPTPKFLREFLAVYKDVSPEWLISGEGEPFNGVRAQANERQPQLESSPCFDVATIEGGTPSEFGDERFTAGFALGRISIPGLPMGDDIPYIQVRGNSMLNRKDPSRSIPDGSWIGLRKVTSTVLQWGNVYSFMTLDGPIVKVVMPSENEGCIRCVSFNEEDGFMPFDLPTTMIIGSFYRVVGVVGPIRFL